MLVICDRSIRMNRAFGARVCRAIAGTRREKYGFLVNTSAALVRAAVPPPSALPTLDKLLSHSFVQLL